ncbi:MAG: hypothetical protein KF819_17300 [Labilithrix sp.]|nr:hypothetical protein [Labilithrix sp.]
MRALPAFALVGVLTVGAGARVAGADVQTLAVRIAEAPSISYDATALGRATHSLRLVVSNPGPRPIALSPLAFRFRATRESVAYACEEPQARDERWPKTLEPATSFTVIRDVTCDTPLPGRYDIEVRARPRGAPDADERTYGSFVMTIEPGANPPVRVPWEPPLHAAASGTKELNPTADPNAAKIVVAMINGTRAPVTLSAQKAVVHVTRRGSRVAPCPERIADLPFTGSLGSGRSQSLTIPLRCDISADAVYDVEVTLASASGQRVRLATHAIRVGVLPPPGPRPEETRAVRGYGGM